MKVHDPKSSKSLSGYTSAEYAHTCSHLGEPVQMPCSGVWLFRREIQGSDLTDLVGPYPLLCTASLKDLRADLEGMGSDHVSLVCVLDPLTTSASTAAAAQVFPDLLSPFKQHFFVDLRGDFLEARSSHHRRSILKATQEVEVDASTDPAEHFQEWRDLYSALRKQKQFKGDPSDFSEAALEAQMRLPGARYYRAISNGQCVAASLWLEQDDRVYYHLGASTNQGRSMKASFAIFDRAITEAGDQGLSWACLGGAAGLIDDASDGLAFFKRGWATHTHTAHLAGKVLNQAAYEELCDSSTDREGYFPAYRDGARR